MNAQSRAAVYDEVLAAAAAAHERMRRQDPGPIVAAAHAVATSIREAGKVLVFGNGGSAADAQHLSAELVGRLKRERAAIGAIALTADTSVLTALANDYSFDRVFARQVEALGRAGDVAIAISTSGNSPNVLAAARAAAELGLITVGLTGADGGKLAALVDHHFNVRHRSTARVQEVHIMVGHILCELVDSHLPGA